MRVPDAANFMTTQWLIIGLATLALVVSCAKPHVDPLRVGTNVWPGYEPLYLARAQGFFEAHPIRLVEHAAATEVMRAFRNGTIDAAALTLDEVLTLSQREQHLRIVLIMDISHGGDALLAQPHIRNFAQLRGKRVGVENSALGAYMLERALQYGALQQTDISIVPVSADHHENQFVNRKIDAVVTFEPVRGKLVDLGAQELFDSAMIAGEIVDVLVVRASYLAENQQIVQALLRGWFRALAFYAQHPQQGVEIMAAREGLSVEDFSRAIGKLRIPSLAENVQQLKGPAPKLLDTAQRMQKIMLERELLNKPVVMQQLIDAEPILKVVK